MMKRKAKWAIAASLAVGMTAGALLFTPSAMKASEEVVLASVDWVTSQLNPMKNDIANLKAQLDAQQQQIQQLQQQLASKPASPSLPSVVYVAKNNAAVRSGASTSYHVITYKQAGASLQVVGAHLTSQGLWYNIILSSSLKGWIYSGDVSTSAVSSDSTKHVIATAAVNIRKGATTSYPIIATVPKGTEMVYIQPFTNSKGEKWYNVQLSDGRRGWMAAEFGEVK
ncbi:SH3 domain-containing protein [Geobacillus stearothermophilus]|uniref:SH3 domain-containing protein n=1 Tax=Geobacillus stearothermophilus TaxID=1422 RepID=UPI001F249BD9|nr:SH3 domain-containing protein [Geobacillus stearothermophilus]MCK7607502.1 SH3 domain-containing protein [Geobacillus stearothermophilus]